MAEGLLLMKRIASKMDYIIIKSLSKVDYIITSGQPYQQEIIINR